ncbi:hypothetical protein M2148_003137, partial [Lachnospiraceae bacterium PF1-4]
DNQRESAENQVFLIGISILFNLSVNISGS